jgi:hypothetical protein
MSDEVAQKVYAGEYETEVDFTYINVKTGKESTHRTTIYEAVLLAERRREDGRYKNFEFHIG